MILHSLLVSTDRLEENFPPPFLSSEMGLIVDDRNDSTLTL